LENGRFIENRTTLSDADVALAQHTVQKPLIRSRNAALNPYYPLLLLNNIFYCDLGGRKGRICALHAFGKSRFRIQYILFIRILCQPN
jgi:hypothetical protein